MQAFRKGCKAIFSTGEILGYLAEGAPMDFLPERHPFDGKMGHFCCGIYLKAGTL
jgi:hypothetical protein